MAQSYKRAGVPESPKRWSKDRNQVQLLDLIVKSNQVQVNPRDSTPGEWMFSFLDPLHRAFLVENDHLKESGKMIPRAK